MMKWGFFCLILILSIRSHGQDEENLLHIRNADSLVYDSDVSNYRKLIGNVLIEHNGSMMHCDSAYVLLDSNFFIGFSNIFIKQGDSVKAYGDKINYYGSGKASSLSGDARLFKGDSKVYSETLYFKEENETAYWLNGGKIIQDGSTLSSERGYYNSRADYFSFRDSIVLIDRDYQLYSDTLGYDPKEKKAHMFGPTRIISQGDTIYTELGFFSNLSQKGQFKNNVRITSADQILYADSVSFDQKDSTGHAIGSVRIFDKKENIWINGEDAFQDHKTNKGIVHGKTEMIQIFENDSLFMHADTFKIEQIGKHKNIFAYYSVKFFRSDLQGSCDSMHFSFADSLIKMNGEPFLWTENNQMSGDTILLLTYDQKIQNIFINSNAFMIEQIDSNRYNQIKGKRMIGYFSENEIYKLDVIGNGETVYWATDSENQLIGVNQTVCSNIRIDMKNNEIKTITFLNKPTSSFSPPLDMDPKELLLKDFVWKEELRPSKRMDIFKNRQ